MNCKPGDLAIITHARGSMKGTGMNIGRICRVIRAHGNETTRCGNTFFCWWIELVGSPGRDANRKPCKEGYFPDAYLKRIDPSAELEDVDEKDALHA
jgi:hypothetical protein